MRGRKGKGGGGLELEFGRSDLESPLRLLDFGTWYFQAPVKVQD